MYFSWPLTTDTLRVDPKPSGRNPVPGQKPPPRYFLLPPRSFLNRPKRQCGIIFPGLRPSVSGDGVRRKRVRPARRPTFFRQEGPFPRTNQIVDEKQRRKKHYPVEKRYRPGAKAVPLSGTYNNGNTGGRMEANGRVVSLFGPFHLPGIGRRDRGACVVFHCNRNRKRTATAS